jgi:hypothetical protein
MIGFRQCVLQYGKDPDGKDRIPVPAQLSWVSAANDWRFTEEWRLLARGSSDAKRIESAEYAKLAEGRWRYLRGRKECALSLEDARVRARMAPATEFGFDLIIQLREGTAKRTVGFCHVRRLWSGNLYPEFLGAFAPLGYSAIGLQLLSGLAFVAERIQSDEIWGECTEGSRGFYQRVKTDLMKQHLDEDLQKKKFTMAGWQLPGAILDWFSFGRNELKLLRRTLEPPMP